MPVGYGYLGLCQSVTETFIFIFYQTSFRYSAECFAYSTPGMHCVLLTLLRAPSSACSLNDIALQDTHTPRIMALHPTHTQSRFKNTKGRYECVREEFGWNQFCSVPCSLFPIQKLPQLLEPCQELMTL